MGNYCCMNRQLYSTKVTNEDSALVVPSHTNDRSGLQCPHSLPNVVNGAGGLVSNNLPGGMAHRQGCAYSPEGFYCLLLVKVWRLAQRVDALAAPGWEVTRRFRPA